MLKGRVHLLLFPLVLAGFLLGIVRLFELRFSHGDVYPPYSSLRADPLGTKALFKGLNSSGLHRSERFFLDAPKLGDGRDTSLLLLGTQPASLKYLPTGELQLLNQFLHTGGQIVIALHPEQKRPYSDELKEKYYEEDHDKIHKRDQQEDAKREKPERRASRRRMAFDSLLKEWGFSVQWSTNAVTDSFPTNVIATPSGMSRQLPAKIACHSTTHFEFQDTNEWDVLYHYVGAPAIARRTFGSGSVLLISDSWVFSNESLRSGRNTRFLSWLFAGRSRVLFDETHLGVHNTEGVASLARRYRLQGLAAGLLLLAILFVWRSSSSLVPAHEDAAVSGAAIAGRHSQDGYVNLLRRSVKPASLLATCHAQWRATESRASNRSTAVKKALETGDERVSAELLINRYRAACKALKTPSAASDKPIQSHV